MPASCPFCGATDSTDNACQSAGVITRMFKSAIGVPAFRVECCCGAQGPAKLDWMDAEGAWDKRAAPSQS